MPGLIVVAAYLAACLLMVAGANRHKHWRRRTAHRRAVDRITYEWQRKAYAEGRGAKS